MEEDAMCHVGWRQVFVVALVSAVVTRAEPVPIVTTVDRLGDRVTTIEAESIDDQFLGISQFDEGLVALGDVNGDGRDDVAFYGSYDLNYLLQGTQANVSYILYGSPSLPPTFVLSAWQEWGVRLEETTGTGRPSLPMAGLGDLDGDGFDDIAFMSCGAGVECPAYILFGGADLPRSIDTNVFEGCRGCTIESDPSLYSVLAGPPPVMTFASGDVDGDGLRDLIAGVPTGYRAGKTKQEGLVYIVFGERPFPSSINLAEIGSAHRGCRITAEFPPCDGPVPRFGYQISSGFDFDGDGIADTVIGKRCGPICVIFGRREWPEALDVALDNPGNLCRIFYPDQGFKDWQPGGSQELLTVPDITGDGTPDLFLGGLNTRLISGAHLAPGDFLLDMITLTTFVRSGFPHEYGVTVGDWDGNGVEDIVFGNSTAEPRLAGSSEQYGGITILSERTSYPLSIEVETERDRATILGTDHASRFGSSIVASDLDGDGKPEILVAAPGNWMAPPASLERLFILRGGDIDLLGPLEGHGFSPVQQALPGGGAITVLGSGFDGETHLYFGSTEVEITERPDSSVLVARIPEFDEEGAYQVKLTRRGDEFIFAEPFRYFDAGLPYEVDIENLGDNVCFVIDPPDEPEGTINFFDLDIDRVEGGADFSGDQQADVLFGYHALYDTAGMNPRHNRHGRIVLLYGSPALPRELGARDLDGWATMFESLDESEMTDEYTAHLIGDMNGDKRSELAIGTPHSGRVYVIFGTPDLPREVVYIQDIIAQGGGLVVEDCAPCDGAECPETRRYFVGSVGDVNGDQKADLGIRVRFTRENVTGDAVDLGSLALVLGRETFPAALRYADLPRIYGMLPEGTDPRSLLEKCEGIGDVDADGVEDMFLSCSYTLPSSDGEIRCVLFGRREWAPATFLDDLLTDGGARELFQTASTCWHGSEVRGIGDQNGDDAGDIGLIRRCTDGSGFPTGTDRVSVIYGGPRPGLGRRRAIERDGDFDVNFPTTKVFNYDMAHLDGGRDFNNDGISDILIGDEHWGTSPPPTRAMVLFGGNLEAKAAPLDRVRDLFQLVAYGQDVNVKQFIDNLDFAGDVNGDGYQDIVAVSMKRVLIYMNPLGFTHVGHLFVRGNVNQDGGIDIADAISILQYLFADRAAPSCMDAADANDDETVNIADPIRLLGWLFGGDAPLPPPRTCGADPGGEFLDCRESGC
jgi:hypothetical protein